MLPPELFAALEREREKQSKDGFDITAELEQRAKLGLNEIYRNALKSVCGTELYNKVRERFITEQQYWRTEENLAKTLCGLLLDHHTIMNDECVSVFDVSRPSMCVLEQLWEDRRVSLERRQQRQTAPVPAPSRRTYRIDKKANSRRTVSVARIDTPPIPDDHSIAAQQEVLRKRPKRDTGQHHIAQRKKRQGDVKRDGRPRAERHRIAQDRDTQQHTRASPPPSSRTRSKKS